MYKEKQLPPCREAEIYFHCLQTSAHVGFIKAANLMDLEIIYVPILENANYLPDIKRFRSAINRNTIMLVASAPQYPQGNMKTLL